MAILSQFKNHSVKTDWQTKKRYLRMIWFFRTYPHVAARMLLGLKLAPHQRIAINTAWQTPRCIWQFSRGMAKTFTEATLISLLEMLYPSYKIQSTAGGSFKQTEQTFDYIESIVKSEVLGQSEKHYARKLLPKQDKVVIKQPSNWSMKMAKGISRGLAIKGGNRGFRANQLTVGEANDIERDTMDKVLRPFLNVLYDPMNFNRRTAYCPVPGFRDRRKEKNFLLLSGTISYDFTYYFQLIKEYQQQMINGNDEYAVIFFDFEDSYIGEQSIDPSVPIVIHKVYYGMDLGEIIAPLKEENVSYEHWLAEQKNIPVASEGKFYPPILVYDSYKLKNGNDSMACLKFESQGICFMGIDPFYGSAKGQKTQNKNAEFALTILELMEDYAQLVHCIGVRNIDYAGATNIILSYLQKFPRTTLIGMDARGGGIPIRDNLRSSKFGNIPIIDPTDPDNAPFLDVNSCTPYRDMLRLLSPTDEFNTIHNESTKNMLQMRTVIIPFTTHGHFDYDRDNRIEQYKNRTEADIEKLYKDLHILKTQLTSVETEATSNYLKFFVRSGQKDRYSSFLYACSMYWKWRLDHLNVLQKTNVPGGAWR